jgi:hypothetical protein
MTSTVLVLWMLAQTTPASGESLHYRARLEVTGLALRPGAPGDMTEGYVQVAPGLTLDGGASWGVTVGAPVRIHVIDGGMGVRARDWDSLSDFGQVLRALRLGDDTSSVALWAGALEDYTLLSGHLVRRYSNRSHPDDHPAGAYLTGTLGPTYAELFASDVLGARLFGGEVALDLMHLVSGPPEQPGRYTLSLSAVRDFGRAGGRSTPISLAHTDLTAVFFYRENLQVHALAGVGARPEWAGAWGAVAGLGLEQRHQRLEVGARLEARLQRGGFRQGFFGPDYELSRFSTAGPSALPAAQAPFQVGHSAFGELVLGWDALDREHPERHLEFSIAVEAFTWGRLDADARVATWLADRRLHLAFNALAVAVGQPGARHLLSGEVRYRFAGNLYALAQGGTLLFPQQDSTLKPGAFISLGLGVDHAR